ncbi:KR domain-containing protein [Hirsutella rhossiliensis]|uniref:KR domain-containing protein n=1 Tax=Hirsutella rhossiliensis TaxID=111463 RepID=A0A9P8N540_9HYPO|nr:KR domain-containing protein [Hirsutella rhossiliensis]KAH0964812.1 KR domain-containing protein [Hirsutella rhossiliensis]
MPFPETQKNEPIALIGSACRFAGGCNSPSQLWEHLRAPHDIRSEIPDSRFNAKGYYHPNSSSHGHTNVQFSYVLDQDPGAFDAGFFGVNPMEAKCIDPQQRMLLETVYEAVESAGLTTEGLRGSDTCVYAGIMRNDYEILGLRDMDHLGPQSATGIMQTAASSRVSYFFDWHGASPCVLATHASPLPAEPTLPLVQNHADGYGRGEGVGAIILKTLAQAVADGDDIECIIRETGINQDGASAGLGAPNADAQAALIRSVYTKAGLDARNPAHRPQFIEAHGTGTPAGDPAEAEALSTAFFGPGEDAGDSPIYAGSAKTFLGHTEATAGIAALVKSARALRKSIIPPNLHFNQLNPAVAPFYGNIQITNTAKPWPTPSRNQPKRVSVNGFGLGGANAHVILESYEEPALVEDCRTPFAPFVFSAQSNASLRANLSAYLAHLDAHPETDLGDLGFTLRERRSAFQHRVAFAAASIEDLKSKMRDSLDPGKDDDRILGVFTGQGAQYPRMGAELIEKSPLARQIVQRLESYLAELPAEDRPTWSLEAEMLADASVSRLGEPDVSHPLSAAVQIVMVDVLASANVRFDVVVGHSGGEVAAAYAAGYLSARDAMCVAYYRGMHCNKSSSPNGEGIKGGMLAVGTSLEDATELCKADEFVGRITVAASNSSTSTTISGDEDALEELAVIMEDENKFHRRLKVDQAYHSKHMLPCRESYIESLRRAGVKSKQAGEMTRRTTWYSSVNEGMLIDPSSDQLGDLYWSRNMVQPVLFSQALASAVEAANSSGRPLAAAVEVGPHPALAGPASQVVQEVLNTRLPYHGCLQRGTDAQQAFSACLGFLWQHLDPATGVPSLQHCEVALSCREQETPRSKVVKDLPTYRWNHEARHWYESRKSRRIRLRDQPYHQLLGHMSPDSEPHALRWSNVLKVSELPWLEGHRVQNQILFPAAGFASTAIEAARFLVPGQEWTSIRMVELDSFNIHHFISFDENDTGVEVRVELSQVSTAAPNCIRANFTYLAARSLDDDMDLRVVAEAQLKVCLGETALDLLPQRPPTLPHVIPVEPSRLYDFFHSLGFNFSGPFCSLTSIERKLDNAFCVAKKATTSSVGRDEARQLLVHPVDLDAAFQTTVVAVGYPGDGGLFALHVPTTIEVMRVNPALLVLERYLRSDYHDINCTIHIPRDLQAPGTGFYGDINLYPSCSETGQSCAAIQVMQIQFKPLNANEHSERTIIYTTHWIPSKVDGVAATSSPRITKHGRELRAAVLRMSAFFLRQLDDAVPTDSPERQRGSNRHYLNFARHTTALWRRGGYPWMKQEWLNDSLQDVEDDIKAKGVGGTVDVRLLRQVNENMPEVLRGETKMLANFRNSRLLEEYYNDGFGAKQTSLWTANVVKQLTDVNPHLRIMEVGAGTGATTKPILNAIGHDFDEFTFTDISTSFFENAAEIFTPWRNQITFKTYNADRDPVKQGFRAGEYDVVIACMVIHACIRLEEAIRHLRTLLKPGGKLILAESSVDSFRYVHDGFVFGTLAGWWRGVDEGRILSPLASVSEWESILKRTGFSVITVDARVDFIRDPISAAAAMGPMYGKVVVLGGVSLPIARLARELAGILRPLVGTILSYRRLEDMDDQGDDDHDTTVVSLTDLEQPVFKDMTPERWYKLRRLFQMEKTILWLSSGRLQDEPYCNMAVGLGRYAAREESIRLQCLDVADPSQIGARAVAETLLRFTNTSLDDEDLLYTKEPEIVMDAEGRELVPRLFPVPEANDRINSARRRVFHQVDMSRSVVELQQHRLGCHLRELSRYETSKSLVSHDSSRNSIQLRTTHSILSALRGPAGCRFIALGVDQGTGARYLVSIPSLASVLRVDKESAVACNSLFGLSEVAFLSRVAAHLASMAIIDPLHPGQKVLVHNATAMIAAAINTQASRRGVTVTFSTDSADKEAPDSWIRLAPFLGSSDIDQVVAADTACFAGFSVVPSENELVLASGLSSQCRTETFQTILSPKGDDAGEAFPAGLVKHHLERALGYIRDGEGSNPVVSEKVSLELLVAEQRPADPLAIVDWTALPAFLPARVESFDSRPMFKSDQTYWLVGLSGDFGVSLCDWMIKGGARYLVLSSRNPKIDPGWIDDHARRGAMIKTYCCDVTDEEAIKRVHQTIVEALPPIAGLMNGAMVLNDVFTRNMSYDQVMEVIRPKFLGTTYLDRLFHDVNLDFFVLFSSVATIAGSAGQANYAAANMGMVTVAQNRRERGLRVSTIHLSPVIGLGYIVRSPRYLNAMLDEKTLMLISEQDFHQLVAECIEAGYLDNPAGPELWVGLDDVALKRLQGPGSWLSDPKVARFAGQNTVEYINGNNKTTSVSIGDRLQTCRSDEDVLGVIKEALGTQLRKALLVSTSDDDLMRMGGVELGFDSLVAVDLRTWMIKNFQANIPVLKMMASDFHMSTLVDLTFAEIPAELIPHARASPRLSTVARGGKQAEG